MLLRRFCGPGVWRWCRCCGSSGEKESEGSTSGGPRRGDPAERQGAIPQSGGGPRRGETAKGFRSAGRGAAAESFALGEKVEGAPRGAGREAVKVPPQPRPSPHPAAASPVSALVAASTLEQLRWVAKHEDRTARFGLYLTAEPCKVIKVYDGDSLTLAWQDATREGRVVFANCRLYGIDAPELRGGTGGAAERAAAERCRDAVSEAFLGELLEFDTAGATGLDKYGRPLVVLRARRGWTSDKAAQVLGGETLNDWILHRIPGVVPYFGGRKSPQDFSMV